MRGCCLYHAQGHAILTVHPFLCCLSWLLPHASYTLASDHTLGGTLQLYCLDVLSWVLMSSQKDPSHHPIDCVTLFCITQQSDSSCPAWPRLGPIYLPAVSEGQQGDLTASPASLCSTHAWIDLPCPAYRRAEEGAWRGYPASHGPGAGLQLHQQGCRAPHHQL